MIVFIYDVILKLQQKHSKRLKEFEKWVEKYGDSEQNSRADVAIVAKHTQLNLHFDGYNTKPAARRKVKSQEEMDEVVIDYLVEDILPVYSTEKLGFRTIMQSVSDFEIRGRKFYTQKFKTIS